jgi:hypothetical protein
MNNKTKSSELKKMIERFVAENYSKFKYKPKKHVKRDAWGVDIIFPDINPLITFYLSDHEMGWNVLYCNRGWDSGFVDYIDGPLKTKKGYYYCEYCLKERGLKPFKKKYDLFEHHLFGKFLEMINRIDDSRQMAIMTDGKKNFGMTCIGEERQFSTDYGLPNCTWIEPTYDSKRLILKFPVVVSRENKTDRKYYSELRKNGVYGKKKCWKKFKKNS